MGQKLLSTEKNSRIISFYLFYFQWSNLFSASLTWVSPEHPMLSLTFYLQAPSLSCTAQILCTSPLSWALLLVLTLPICLANWNSWHHLQRKSALQHCIGILKFPLLHKHFILNGKDSSQRTISVFLQDPEVFLLPPLSLGHILWALFPSLKPSFLGPASMGST